MTKEQAHILLVEDDPATQALLSAFLREAGYSVSGAATAEAMRQAMARASVDLILLISICRMAMGFSWRIRCASSRGCPLSW